MRQKFIKNASGFLLKNETVLLQNATVTRKYGNSIAKCDSFYKICRYNDMKLAREKEEFFE